MPGPPLSPLRALRHRNFRLFLFGQTVSLAGTWMGQVAQAWLVLQLTDSAFYVGLVSAAGGLPVLLASLPAGVYADRVNKLRLVRVTQVLSMVQALALAALVFSGWATVWWVIALALWLGFVNAFDIPTRQALVIEMAGREDLLHAIALNSAVFNATRIVGPAIAGVLISALGVGVCFLVNGLSYVAVIASIRALRLPPFRAGPTASSAWERFREGARFVRRDRRVAALVTTTATLSIFAFSFLVLMPVFARDVLRVGPTGFGLLMAAVGVGAVAGALGLAALGSGIRKGRLVTWSGPLFALVVALFAASRSFALSVAILALAGCLMILNNAVTNTLIQVLVPDALRARVMAVYTFMFVGMAPLGALQAGVVAGRFGAPLAVAVGGLAAALITLLVWRLVPEVRGLA